MSKNMSVNNKYLKSNILIVFSFIALSLLSVIFIWYRNKIYFTGDAPFHIQRLGELLKSNELFPSFAFNSFDSVGSAVMTMYPYLFLFPAVIIFHIVKNVKITLYITFIIGTFIGLLVSFYSSRQYCKKSSTSYVFSLLYSFSYEFICMYFSSNIIGVYWSSIFLPLVIFGSIYLLKYNKWIMFSIGISLIICNSIITTLFLSSILLIWFLWNYKLLNVNKLFSIIKAIVLTLITTAFIWIPMFKLSIFNKMYLPSCSHIRYIGLNKLILYSLFPSMSIPTLTIYSILGVIIGIICYKRFSILTRHLYLMAVLIVILSSIFPWKIFDGQFFLFRLIRKIQFSWRLLIIPNVVLTFIFSLCISYYLKHKSHKVITVLIFIISLIILVQPVWQHISLNVKGINEPITNTKLMQNYSVQEDYRDYLPKISTDYMKELHHHYFVNYGERVYFHSLRNGEMKFNLKKNMRHVTIPFVYYNGNKYFANIDNKRSIGVNPTRGQLVNINDINKGNHIIHLHIPLDLYTQLSRIVSLISIFIYVYFLFKKRKRKLYIRNKLVK